MNRLRAYLMRHFAIVPMSRFCLSIRMKIDNEYAGEPLNDETIRRRSKVHYREAALLFGLPLGLEAQVAEHVVSLYERRERLPATEEAPAFAPFA